MHKTVCKVLNRFQHGEYLMSLNMSLNLHVLCFVHKSRQTVLICHLSYNMNLKI